MGRALLLIGCTRNLHTRAPINVNRKSAAIESLQIRAAKVIGGADELRGGARDGNSTVSSGLGLARDAAACDHQQRQNDRDRIAQALNLTRRPCSVRWNLVYSASGADVAHLRTGAHCAGLEQLCHGLP